MLAQGASQRLAEDSEPIDKRPVPRRRDDVVRRDLGLGPVLPAKTEQDAPVPGARVLDLRPERDVHAGLEALFHQPCGLRTEVASGERQPELPGQEPVEARQALEKP